MTILRRNGLSARDAEGYLAAVWRLLEAFEIASPRLQVSEQGDGRLAISLKFDDDADVALGCSSRVAPHVFGVVPTTSSARHFAKSAVEAAYLDLEAWLAAEPTAERHNRFAAAGVASE